MTSVTSVVNISKKILNSKGVGNLEEWLDDPHNVYIGRNMSHYVKGAIGSKWQNKFSSKKYGLDKCLELYEESLKSNPKLLNDLHELKGKKLGCWCKPNKCHGDILVRIIDEMYN